MRFLPRVTKRRIVLLCAATIALACAPVWMPWLAARYDLYRGRAALQRFQTDAALEWLRAADGLRPDDDDIEFFLARALRRAGRFDDMERHLERSARLGFSAMR